MKSLRSTGTLHGRAHRVQVIQRAAEAPLLGQHADDLGAAGLVVRGQRGRVGDRGQRARGTGWTA